MINVMDHVTKPMNEVDKTLDGQLWHACAGGMVQMPEVNAKIYYFPQGHAEHAAAGNGGFRDLPKTAPYILCRVSAVKFMADTETDEVYARIGLVPLGNDKNFDLDDDGLLGLDRNKNENQDKPTSFAKTLTQSDANNGGGFSVPRYCAETIFPRLDYTAEPPVQNILAKDVHGKLWKFRHIYRGTPRRHLLTTGWSNFVNQKKLVAGDSIVFLRADNGDLCVGIRRAKRGFGRGFVDANSSGWNTAGNAGKVSVESVVEAANLAAAGRAFEVVYYPRASTPEFCVKASIVKAAMRIHWCPDMRFKMAFETEDSSRISWFMGTISSVGVEDQFRWPNSPWRLLQVAWDEPDLLQNVKRVSPWLVELVSSVPSIHLSPFSPPRKKLRIQQPPDFPILSMPPMMMMMNHIPASIQGARQFGYDHHHHQQQQQPHFNKIQSFPFGLPSFPPSFMATPQQTQGNEHENNEKASCLLTIGNIINSKTSLKDEKKPTFVLFGQPIFTKQQLSDSSSGDTLANHSDGSVVVQNGPVETSSDEASPWLGYETGHCKIFMESEDVGRTLDLAAFHSYEELHRKLADMFCVEKSVMLNNLIYRTTSGAVKHTGDEPFSEFSKTAQRLTIVMDSGSEV